MAADLRELDVELQRAGGCSMTCAAHLGSWTAMPESFVVVTEHRGFTVPFAIKRLPGQQYPSKETFVALLMYWADRTPGWHTNPGSEDDWRKKLSPIETSGEA